MITSQLSEKANQSLYENEITDVETLSALTDQEMQEIGIPLGDRKKLQNKRSSVKKTGR